MNYSLSKIANELGLSKATVSLIMNGKAKQARISSEAEQRVKDFCEKVNYVPNIHAQRINRKFVKNIGLLVERDMLVDGDNPFADQNISEITGGVVLEAEKCGYRVTIQVYTPEMEDNKIFDWFFNHEIDGLIYYGLNIPENWIQTFVDYNLSVVGIGAEPCEGITSVNINNYELMKELTNTLIESGRKSLVYINGIDKSYTSRERKRGFLSASPTSPVYDGGFSEQVVCKLVKKILKENKDVDAIVCANDDMAFGALSALKSLKIPCPDKIAVTGADNIRICNYTNPSITSIENKNTLRGKMAFKQLRKLLRGEKCDIITLDSHIVYRNSM